MSGAGMLSPDQIDSLIAAHPQWDVDGNALRRQFEFADFVEAFAFMTKVALIAEKRFHHPEWSNVWSRVIIRITDHEAGGISGRDAAFVEAVDRLVAD